MWATELSYITLFRSQREIKENKPGFNNAWAEH